MSDHTLVLYDGVCGFCNASIQFLLARDPAGHFQYAPLQSALARDALAKHGVTPDGLDTVYVIVGHGTPNEQVLARSDAALHCAAHLPLPWRLARVAAVLPRFLRDAAYNLVARYRYQIFGKLDACMIPDPKVRDRFLA